MSFWINRMACRSCSSEINISGGMVGTTWMGPQDNEIVCPNPSCNTRGYDNFVSMGSMDRNNPEHRTDLTFCPRNHLPSGG